MNLKPGLLRLSQWTKDFSHASQKQTRASIWVRLLELPQEYWREITLKEIASAVGTPIDIDGLTHNRSFGHYAQILVDIDLSKRAYDEILVECEGYAFKVEVQYERRSLFCHHCFTIGHNVTTCKWLHQETINDAPDRGKNPVADTIPTGTAQIYQIRRQKFQQTLLLLCMTVLLLIHSVSLRKYDKKSKEEEFTPVLSKKQKQKLRQQIVLGKPQYKTRSRGPTSPIPQ